MNLIIVIVTSIFVGGFAQQAKGRTGAAWGAMTFFIIVAAWLVLYFGMALAQPDLERDWVFFRTLTIMVCAGVAVVMGVIVATLPKPKTPSDRDSKKCPFCAEVIRREAVVCRYCGRDLPKPQVEATEGEGHKWESLEKASAEDLPPLRRKDTGRRSAFAVAVIIISVVAIGAWFYRDRQARNPEQNAGRATAFNATQYLQAPKGMLKIPGGAFIDGRDVEADPPVTIMTSMCGNNSVLHMRHVVFDMGQELK